MADSRGWSAIPLFAALLGVENFRTGPGAVATTDKIKCAYPFRYGFAPTHIAQGTGYFAEEDLEISRVFDNDRANVSRDTVLAELSQPLSDDELTDVNAQVRGQMVEFNRRA